MRVQDAAALALVGWYLMVPLCARAQSQLQTPPSAALQSNSTLEIPVVVQPNQPPLDPMFVGAWCGDEQFKFYADAPPGSAISGEVIRILYRQGEDVALRGDVGAHRTLHFGELFARLRHMESGQYADVQVVQALAYALGTATN